MIILESKQNGKELSDGKIKIEVHSSVIKQGDHNNNGNSKDDLIREAPGTKETLTKETTKTVMGTRAAKTSSTNIALIRTLTKLSDQAIASLSAYFSSGR